LPVALIGASANGPVHPASQATAARFRSPTDPRAAAPVASAALLRYHETGLTLVFSLARTDRDFFPVLYQRKPMSSLSSSFFPIGLSSRLWVAPLLIRSSSSNCNSSCSSRASAPNVF